MKLKRAMILFIITATICIAAISIAGCSKEAASVTFMVDNSVYGIVKVRDGNESLPENPVKDLYTFEGWYEDKELTTEFDYSAYAANSGRGDLTVYAGFKFNGNTYSVTLNGNGGKFGEDEKKNIDVRESETVTSVAVPVREGYELTGWSQNKNGTKPWNLSSDKVTADTVLYAVWTKTYTVTFNANGSITQNTVYAGDLLDEPEEPARSGYTFIGWATASNALEPDWDFEKDAVNADVTLYAVWETEVTEHNVEFVLNYAGAKNEIKSTVRGLIAYEPERAGYIFKGWYNSDGEKDAEGNYILTAKFDTSKKITDDEVKVYAYWINEDDICRVLPTPVLNISGGDILWEQIEGAESYDIVIWNEKNSEDNYTVKRTVEETNFTLSASNAQGRYYVKVRANGDGYTTVNSGWTNRSFEFKKLSSPSHSFDLTTSILSWSSVKNATKYELYIDEALITLSENAFEYDFSDYDAGNYKVEIKVTASGYAEASATFSVSKLKLKAPQVSAVYNTINKTYELRWDKVLHADKYIVTIDGEETKIDATSYKIPSSVWGDKKELTFKVDAFDTNADYLISDAKADKLGLPAEITLKTEGANEIIKVNNGMARYCTVTLNLKGGSITSGNGTKLPVAFINVNSDSGINYPDVPARDGYLFTGWYKDYECKNLFDLTQTFNADTTLYAGWYKMPESSSTLNNKAFSLIIPQGGVQGTPFTTTSTAGTSSTAKNYVYYWSPKSGNYDFSYTNGDNGSNYGTYFSVYNVTQGEVIKERTHVTTKAQYVSDEEKFSYTADAGDIIRVEIYRSNTNYSSSFEFGVSGGQKPAAGGKFAANCYTTNKTYYVTNNKNFNAGTGTVVELTVPNVENKNFLGWYTEDGKLISEEKTFYYTVESATTLTAKWE